MYRERFGTDWTQLRTEAAIDRMFALGAAAAFDEEHPDEYDRLRDVAETRADRRLMELAFEEGRARALGRRDDAGEADAADETWAAVVGEEVDLPPEPDPAHETASGPTRPGLPERIGRSPLLDLPRDNLERIRLPSFLRRED